MRSDWMKKVEEGKKNEKFILDKRIEGSTFKISLFIRTPIATSPFFAYVQRTVGNFSFGIHLYGTT